LESWCTSLLRWRIVDRLLHDLLVHVLVLLCALVHEVALLSSDWVVVRIDSRLSTHHWCDYWLHLVLDLLLLIHVLWCDRRRSKLLLHLVSQSQVQSLELLGSGLHVDELLLQTLLLLCEVHVGSYQLSIEVRIHLFLAVLINEDLGRCKRLLRNGVHLTIAVHLVISILLLGVAGSFRSTITLFVRINACTKPSIMLQLGGWSRRGERAGSGGLWGCSQTCKQVRPGGARCRSTIVLGVGWLGWLEGEAFESRCICPSGSKARAGHSQSITGWEVVVGHLSKTACVHTRSVMLYRWVG